MNEKGWFSTIVDLKKGDYIRYSKARCLKKSISKLCEKYRLQ